MTNPKTRKTGKKSTMYQHEQQNAIITESVDERRAAAAAAAGDATDDDYDDDDEQCDMLSTCMQQQMAVSTVEADSSLTPTPTENNDMDEDTEGDTDSCSSFSLQECIDQFHARRIRRKSTQSRDVCDYDNEREGGRGAGGGGGGGGDASSRIVPVDEDLINQNRTNREHERKCKPCENGFCYCFTSDSGDGGGGGGGGGGAGVRRLNGGGCGDEAARGAHVRHSRRQRKSESGQGVQTQHATALERDNKAHTQFTASTGNYRSPKKSPNMKRSTQNVYSSPTANNSSQLTAISRLDTTAPDAPMIHIIQELHDNCVISEVRVNRHKIQAHQRSHSLSSKPSPKKTQFNLETVNSRYNNNNNNATTKATAYQAQSSKQPYPSAPALDKLSELESEGVDDGFVYSSPLHSSSKSNDSQRQRSKAAGRLLQKRLSCARIQFKPRNLNEPPPKPPRSSIGFEDKASVSTLNSTSPSVRDAERVLDEFLRRRGIKVPSEEHSNHVTRRSDVKAVGVTNGFAMANKDLERREKRKSYPITQTKERRSAENPLPSCPSLSDIERAIDGKKSHSYAKNLRHKHEKPVKEISIGWKEPRIEDMLNYEANDQPKKFTSQAVQAEPQYHIGWEVPHKVDLDTVDAGVGYNLASNIGKKHTPIKSRLLSGRKSKTHTKKHSQKFILYEQFRNLSPWTRRQSEATVNGGGSQRTQPLKSNLKTASRAFLNNSKQKILRLVSPKKDNNAAHHRVCVHQTPKCNVAVQTSSPVDVVGAPSYENSSTPQSPPGSYHSAVPTSMQSNSSRAQNTNDTPDSHFDFTRTVRSPPRKATTRSSQRRLNFPLNCVEGSDCIDGDSGKGVTTLTKTYRSFQADLDQDVTLSKMGYILGNIRAKLEASDMRAERTFQETAQRSGGFDCPDSFDLNRTGVLQRCREHRRLVEWEHDPIYSEIEEDSMHIAGSPQFDNKTGVEHFPVQHNPEVLYAKVNKSLKTNVAQALTTPPPKPTKPPKLPVLNTSTPTPLGKFLHDSLTQRQADKLSHKITPTHTSHVKGRHSDVSYTSVMAAPMPTEANCTALIHHCQSLNNVRVAEHHSPPKSHRNLSKSDLSLHRSEIFLENLCRSELTISTPYLEKVENRPTEADVSYTSVPAEDNDRTQSSANASFELTNASVYECSDSNAAGSYLGLDALASTHTRNQSTPMKQQTLEQQNTNTGDISVKRSKNFITKLQPEHEILAHHPAICVAVSNESLRHAESLQLLNQSCSCPTTPHCVPPLPTEPPKRQAVSLDAVYAYNANHTNEPTFHNNSSTNKDDTSLVNRSRYKRLKNVIRLSFRRSKKFLKTETKRLSTSLNLPSSQSTPNTSNQSDRHNQSYSTVSDFDLDAFFSLNGNAADELVKAVSICRQLPDLEVSAEMVEAERLLLYSTLRRDAAKHKLQLVKMQAHVSPEACSRRFFIDGMRLPIKANASQDLFFNYFYICTFECGGVIKSTQSVECCNGEAIFGDCGIEFNCNGVTQSSHDIIDDCSTEIRCQVFMLRLRKVSTLSLEPRRRVVKLPDLLTPSPTSSSSSGSDAIVSRFKLHATFTLRARDFAPYEYVAVVSKQGDCICLRASRNSQSIALSLRSKSTNLSTELLLTGRAEVRLPKRTQSGYLNVQNPYTMHNWNRRWCTLDGFLLNVWTDEHVIAEQPLLSLDMRTNRQALPLTTAARELCGRPRSFCVQCAVKNCKKDAADSQNASDIDATAAVFFTADNQDDLNAWLHELNEVLHFMRKWLY